MTPGYFCTLFDSVCLIKGLTMILSLRVSVPA
jgi:hypothetical protein